MCAVALRRQTRRSGKETSHDQADQADPPCMSERVLIVTGGSREYESPRSEWRVGGRRFVIRQIIINPGW